MKKDLILIFSILLVLALFSLFVPHVFAADDSLNWEDTTVIDAGVNWSDTQNLEEPTPAPPVQEPVAEQETAELAYPEGCNTVSEMELYCLAAKDAVEEDHNAKGQAFREGTMSEKDWKKYKTEVFDARQGRVMHDLVILKEQKKELAKATYGDAIDVEAL